MCFTVSVKTAEPFQVLEEKQQQQQKNMKKCDFVPQLTDPLAGDSHRMKGKQTFHQFNRVSTQTHDCDSLLFKQTKRFMSAIMCDSMQTTFCWPLLIVQYKDRDGDGIPAPLISVLWAYKDFREGRGISGNVSFRCFHSNSLDLLTAGGHRGQNLKGVKLEEKKTLLTWMVDALLSRMKCVNAAKGPFRPQHTAMFNL